MVFIPYLSWFYENLKDKFRIIVQFSKHHNELIFCSLFRILYKNQKFGGELEYIVEEKDTVALTEDDLLRIFNDALSLNEDGEYVIQEYYTGDVLPAPDSTVITTTYHFYINNIALVSKDDSVDHGDGCGTL